MAPLLCALLIASIAVAACSESTAPIALRDTPTGQATTQTTPAPGSTAGVTTGQTPDAAAGPAADDSAQPDPLREAVANGSVTADYTVQRGDTLGSIAAATGSSVADLQHLNQMGRSVALYRALG